eukprot:scaffold100570_cov87-Phaeocystis_antarctica.AAC.2
MMFGWVARDGATVVKEPCELTLLPPSSSATSVGIGVGAASPAACCCPTLTLTLDPNQALIGGSARAEVTREDVEEIFSTTPSRLSRARPVSSSRLMNFLICSL